MQKFLLLLLFAALLTPLAKAQTTYLHAKWTTDHKVVLESLPDAKQDVLLPLPANNKKTASELQSISQKMTNVIATWKVADDGSGLLISLGREHYPQWTREDWEMYINRVMGVYFPKE